MIRHIVFFKAKSPDVSEDVFNGLMILKKNPHYLHLEIGRNLKSDTISAPDVDFVVYGEYQDVDQLEAFKAHETYAQSIKIVRPLRDLRLAADFFAE